MFNILRRAMRPATPLFISAFLSVGLVTAAEANIAVTDVLGRHVILEKPAEHMMLGFFFEDYIAIVGDSAVDRLKAISLNYWHGYRPQQYDSYLKVYPKIADLIDIGDVDAATMSAEKIIGARPDIVILSAGQFEYLGASAHTIENVGIPIVVVDYNVQTVEKHVQSTRIIGQVMGADERAETLAKQYQEKVADTLSHVEKAKVGAEKPRVYVELGKGSAQEYGNTYGNGMWAGVIDAVGGLNIAAGKIATWGPLNPEYVLSSKPEAIFITGSEWTSLPSAVLMGFGIAPETTRSRATRFLKRPGWSDIPAVRNGEVYAIYHCGTRTLYDYAYLRFMAKALYPDAFQDVDPQAELAAYYSEYLPVKLDGTFMLKIGSGQ